MSTKSGLAGINGARLYYEVAGAANPLVLIHGGFGDCRHWDKQFGVFAGSRQATRYDMRGYGRSSLPVGGKAYSHHEDLKSLLHHLGISKAHLLGHCAGFGRAVEFAITYPEMSRSLIAAGPWLTGYRSPATEGLFPVIDEIPSVLKEKGPKAAAAHFWGSPFMSRAIRSAEVAERLKDIAYDYSFWHSENEDPVRRLDPPAMNRLSSIAVPTLIITAEYDLEACRTIADLLEESIEGAKKVVIPDAGHIMNMEAPGRFNEIVLDFLEAIGTSS